MTDKWNKHVLIVEDSKELQYLLGYLFKGEGFTFTQAFNGEEALKALRSMPRPPAFILLDIMMPVMDGIVFRQEQRKDPALADIPVVMMTADAEPAEKARQLGVEHFFKKPIHDVDRLMEVATQLSLSSTRQAENS